MEREYEVKISNIPKSLKKELELDILREFPKVRFVEELSLLREAAAVITIVVGTWQLAEKIKKWFEDRKKKQPQLKSASVEIKRE